MSETPAEPTRTAGAVVRSAALQLLVATLVLLVFAGMGALVYLERLPEGPFVFFSGVLVGYLVRLGGEIL